LDVRISKLGTSLGFDVYRKPKNTQRCIPASSFHPDHYKLPLSDETFKSEVEYIKDTAFVNGYSKDIVERLLKKHLLRNVTTLRWAGLVYHPKLFYKFANVLRKHAIWAAPRTTRRMSQLLSNSKDEIDDHK
jgi:hypothetical protein